MDTYEQFAEVYDELMDNVPYEDWADSIVRTLSEYGIDDGLVLELGCGTGTMTELLCDAGYDMIGVDSSMEMLQIARESQVESGKDSILYLLQDMREFELYGTVRAIVSVCDSINYITDEQDLLQVFRLVNNYLDPSGLFIFDFNTEHKYRDIIGDNVIAEDREDVSFIWTNDYDEDAHLNYLDLSVFVLEEDGRYSKFEEEHIQRGYTLKEMIHIIEESGLVYVGAFDEYSRRPADEHSERIVLVAKEHGKEGGTL